ncbi:hypothetical protein EVAR_28396_1 [Eumeta japonica]|uniref:Uncharacterized protein n=1 Tax=Eumeta variegata TaxID=151549 RepID=A0A4C1XG57_EUMVA|nr:hypothetical protein EVAR_28396_1 [Eumeta japonica]
MCGGTNSSEFHWAASQAVDTSQRHTSEQRRERPHDRVAHPYALRPVNEERGVAQRLERSVGRHAFAVGAPVLPAPGVVRARGPARQAAGGAAGQHAQPLRDVRPTARRSGPPSPRPHRDLAFLYASESECDLSRDRPLGDDEVSVPKGRNGRTNKIVRMLKRTTNGHG